jgi:HEAT repeat protein
MLEPAGVRTRVEAMYDHAVETVPQLINALGDEYLDVRLAAATALGFLVQEANSALPDLRQLAQDANVLISETALESVDRIMKP